MTKSEVTTIQLDRSVVDLLKSLKRYGRETYSETILNLIKNLDETRVPGTIAQKVEKERINKTWEERDYSRWEWEGGRCCNNNMGQIY